MAIDKVPLVIGINVTAALLIGVSVHFFLDRTAGETWGQTVGYLRDINGFLVEICTKVE